MRFCIIVGDTVNGHVDACGITAPDADARIPNAVSSIRVYNYGWSLVENEGKILPHIQLFNFALGDKEGTAHLVSSGDGSASLTHRTFFTHHSSDGPIVSVRRLSEYIESKIALLKIDIEGAEVSVLRELQQSSKIKLISQIVVEFHHDNADIPLEEFVEILVSNGFLCRQEHDRRHPNTAFSIVYATRKLI